MAPDPTNFISSLKKNLVENYMAPDPANFLHQLPQKESGEKLYGSRSRQLHQLPQKESGEKLYGSRSRQFYSSATYTSEYIFVKIDQLACINEREFTNGSCFIETLLTGPLNQMELDAVRSIAVDIVRAAAVSENHGSPLTQRMKDIILSYSLSWPVVMHEHVIVE